MLHLESSRFLLVALLPNEDEFPTLAIFMSSWSKFVLLKLGVLAYIVSTELDLRQVVSFCYSS